MYLTVFEDANEQGFVGFAVPPVGRDLRVERLGNPDIQLAATEINISKRLLMERSRSRAFHFSSVRLVFPIRREGKTNKGERKSDYEPLVL